MFKGTTITDFAAELLRLDGEEALVLNERRAVKFVADQRFGPIEVRHEYDRLRAEKRRQQNGSAKAAGA